MKQKRTLRTFTLLESDTTTAVIPLSQGKVAYVDANDALMLCKHNWCAVERKEKNTTRWYARRSVKGEFYGSRKVYMHREIMQPPAELGVDHRDHDGLNNRRSNLRLANDSQNQMNRVKPPVHASKYRGVVWNKRNKNWTVRFWSGKKDRWIGVFPTEELAGRAWDAEAIKYDPEFANLNFPLLTNQTSCSIPQSPAATA